MIRSHHRNVVKDFHIVTAVKSDYFKVVIAISPTMCLKGNPEKIYVFITCTICILLRQAD
jgi:hypothetical protein